MAQPLAGKRIGVTAARKAQEQISALQRRGAQTIAAPCVRYIALDDDPDLRAATDEILRNGLDKLVITTGMGLRGWLSAAGEWGLADELHTVLSKAEILARGPKAVGVIRSLGLRESWSAPEETDAQLLAHLKEIPVTGQRIAVQQHGEPLPEFSKTLTGAGADVVEVLPYRWTEPDDIEPVIALVDEVLADKVDALTFTSAPAAIVLLTIAARERDGDSFHQALARTTLACVGDVTAKPLRDRGLDVLVPARSRTGAMLTMLSDRLSER